MRIGNGIQVTIASGASLSGGADIKGMSLVGIIIPSAWTAADLTFQGSADGGTTYNNVYSSAGVEVQFQVSTSRHMVVDPTQFLGMSHIKVRSGTSGSATTQGADRVLTLITRPVA
jgi:hypothetical protein